MASKQPSRQRHSLPVTSSDYFHISKQKERSNERVISSLLRDASSRKSSLIKDHEFRTRPRWRTAIHVHFAEDTKDDAESSEDEFDEQPHLPKNKNSELEKIKMRIYKTKLKAKIWPYYPSNKISLKESQDILRENDHRDKWLDIKHKLSTGSTTMQAARQRANTFPSASNRSYASLRGESATLTAKDAVDEQPNASGNNSMKMSNGNVPLPSISKRSYSMDLERLRDLLGADMPHPFGRSDMITRKDSSKTQTDLKKGTRDGPSLKKELSLKIKEFMKSPQPEASLPSLQVPKNSALDPIQLQTGRQRKHVSRPSKRTKSVFGVPINVVSCPSLSQFEDRKWYYQDKTGGCRYIRKPESPLPPVASVFTKEINTPNNGEGFDQEIYKPDKL